MGPNLLKTRVLRGSHLDKAWLWLPWQHVLTLKGREGSERDPPPLQTAPPLYGVPCRLLRCKVFHTTTEVPARRVRGSHLDKAWLWLPWQHVLTLKGREGSERDPPPLQTAPPLYGVPCRLLRCKVFHTTTEVPARRVFEAQHLYRALGSPVGLSRRQSKQIRFIMSEARQMRFFSGTQRQRDLEHVL